MRDDGESGSGAAEDGMPPACEIHLPREQTVPFVFNSPHSGRFYPPDFLASTCLDRNDIRRSEDLLVDRLFAPVVRLGAPLMSASALRFAREVSELQERAGSLGTLSSVVSVGPGDWYNYGVHAVEMYQTLVGPGARWVHRFAAAQRDVAIVGYDDGPSVVVETLRDATYVFHLVAYGADGWAQCQVTDADAFYTRMMAAALEMARTGRAPLRRAQTLEVLAVLHAGQRSAETGQRVYLDDLLP